MRVLASIHTQVLSGARRWRWAALGAAVAVSIGAGGVLTTSASVGSGERSVFVPIAPCRLIDTRPSPDNVGGRSSPLGPGEVLVVTVRGASGNCTIPADAIGVAMNVTAIRPSASSFLTVYPADVPRPTASNLNWSAGQAPTPNSVTSRLSADGRVAFYNLGGTVDLAADINGYYVDHTHDDRYPTKVELVSGGGDIGILERMSDAQLAMKRWDKDPARNATIPVGSSLGAVAFDGSSIWVGQVAVGPGTVLKVDPASNAVLATITGPAVPYPTSLVFDGQSMWAFSLGFGVAARIDPVTNAVAGPFQIGNGSQAITGATFDGTDLWVSMSGTPSVAARVSVRSGAVLNSYAVGNNPFDIAFDGRNIWVANANSNTLTKIDPVTGVAATASFLSTSPYLLAFDGQYLWVRESSTLRRIDPTTNAYVGPGITVQLGPSGMFYDGHDIWLVTNDGLQRVDRLSNSVTTVDALGSAAGVFDGTNVWYLARTPARLQKITP